MTQQTLNSWNTMTTDRIRAPSNPPPIQWLVVFEAAATHRSFKLAASALNVSPPAISQHIKSLEEWLGMALFNRRARQIELTTEGEFYYEIAAELVRTHKQGYQDFIRRFQQRSLRVSASLFIAQELMIPNYLSFSDYAEDVELRIEARSSYVDFETEPLDAAIRFGVGDWPDLESRLLCKVQLVPVCSPKYACENSVNTLDDLRHHRLISPSEDTRLWHRVLGEEAVTNGDILVCDSYLAAVKSAAEGLGVTLALLPSTNLWIKDGRLVRFLDVAIPTDFGYWMVSPKQSEQRKEVEAFYFWISSLFESLDSVK